MDHDFEGMKAPLVLPYLLFICLLACSEKKQESPIHNSKEKLIALLADKGFNGSFLYAKKGQKILDINFGYRDFASQDTLRADHTFYLASVSKQITAMACLILVDKGKLDLENKLSQYFPEIPYADSVSIRQMLQHTSGIPDYYGLGVYKAGMKNADVLAALLEGTHLDFESGSKFSYSNSAYVLLAMVVEKVSGQSFASFVHNNIFEPLGMKASLVFDENADNIQIRAVGHTESGEIKDYQAFTTGGGGIFSHTSDLFLWERALYTEKIIPQTLLKEAYTPAKLADGSLSYYGMGWFLDEENPNVVWHTGSLEGFRNLMWRNLEEESLYLFLGNNSYGKLKELQVEIQKIIEAA